MPRSGMHIEAVTVCLHYDDFLEQTIRVNQPLFDDWVVVTSQADAGTIAVCTRYGVRTAFCPYFNRGGEDFAKAPAINIGLAHLKLEDWVLHLDADIALPRNTRKHLANVELDPSCIHGIDRVECPSFAEWLSTWSTPTPTRSTTFIMARAIGRSVPGSGTSITADTPPSGSSSSGTGRQESRAIRACRAGTPSTPTCCTPSSGRGRSAC